MTGSHFSQSHTRVARQESQATHQTNPLHEAPELPADESKSRDTKRKFPPSIRAATKLLKSAKQRKLAASRENGGNTLTEDLPNSTVYESLPIPYTRRVEGILDVSQLRPTLQEVTTPPAPKPQPIAALAHGLDRVLFNQGVHWLQDPRSQVYNFTDYLESIPNVREFGFERLQGFITSSHDPTLYDLAKHEQRPFAGSTSSLSGMLSHVYFLISGDKEVNTDLLSLYFQRSPKNFTPGQRMPVSVALKYKKGVYLADSQPDIEISGKDEKNVLVWLGTMLEKFLTTPPQQFTTLMRSSKPPDEATPKREAYRYSKSPKFIMRAQLDCQDSRLPGTGVFDIKTRAALPTRLDVLNYEEHIGYLIKTLHGELQSFEREYYDLIRSAFLKYSFQARIGNMDGVFVAYHNTARMFGFQYIPLDEMDERLFGAGGETGERVFEKCVGLLEEIVEEATLCFPRQSIRCIFETLENTNKLRVWIEPLRGEQGPRQMKMLEVTVTNYINNQAVSGPNAIKLAAKDPWAIHWTIIKSSTSSEKLLQRFTEVRQRQFRAFNIPSGVELTDMEDFWGQLDFRGGSAKVPFIRDMFQFPSKGIKRLRQVAKEGLEELERRREELEGKAPVFLSDPRDNDEEPISSDARLDALKDAFATSEPADATAVDASPQRRSKTDAKHLSSSEETTELIRKLYNVPPEAHKTPPVVGQLMDDSASSNEGMAIDSDSIQSFSEIDSSAEAEASNLGDDQVSESDTGSGQPMDEVLPGIRSLSDSEGVDVAFTHSNLTLETSADAELEIPETFGIDGHKSEVELEEVISIPPSDDADVGFNDSFAPQDEDDVLHASEDEMASETFPQEVEEPSIIETTQALPVDPSDMESRQVHEIESESESPADEVSAAMPPDDQKIFSDDDFTHSASNSAVHSDAIVETSIQPDVLESDTQLPNAPLRHSDSHDSQEPFLDTSLSATDVTSQESSLIQEDDVVQTLKGSTAQETKETETLDDETLDDETSGEQTLTDGPTGSDGGSREDRGSGT